MTVGSIKDFDPETTPAKIKPCASCLGNLNKMTKMRARLANMSSKIRRLENVLAGKTEDETE